MVFSVFLENISNLSKTSLTLTSSSELTKEIANNNGILLEPLKQFPRNRNVCFFALFCNELKN
jgi:hypothetical protein